MTRKAVSAPSADSLTSLLDEALALLEPRYPALPGPSAPLPSLLDRCEALLSRTRGPDPLRVLCSMGGTAGPEMGRWLALLPNVTVIEGDKLAELVPAGIEGALRRGMLAAALGRLQRDLAARGGRLLLLCTLAPEDVGLLERLRQDGVALSALAFTRFPMAAWRALAPEPEQRCRAPLEERCAEWLDLLERLGPVSLLREEDCKGEAAIALAELATRFGLADRHGLDDLSEQLSLLHPPPRAGQAPVSALLPVDADLQEADAATGPAFAALCALLRHDPATPAAVPALPPLDPPALLAAPRTARSDWSDLLPRLPVILSCHHKSGTSFLRKTFDDITARFGLRMWMKFYTEEPARGWDICLHQHARVRDLLTGPDFRGLHCIRHPKALIHSAALYHQKCREPWVDVPLDAFTSATFWSLSNRDTYNRLKDPATSVTERRDLLRQAKTEESPSTHFAADFDFAGRTYREILTSAPSMSEKLSFEMRCFSRGVILDMLMFPKDRRFDTITLEEISHDTGMTALRRAFRHLGFQGAALEICLELAARHCLWNLEHLPTHATTGVGDGWRQHFHGAVEQEYRRLFGYAESALGYAE